MNTDGGQRRILLVEDEAVIALSQRRMLEGHGYDVAVAHSGEAALEAVRTDPGIALVRSLIAALRGVWEPSRLSVSVEAAT